MSKMNESNNDDVVDNKGTNDLSEILSTLSPELCSQIWIFGKVNYDKKEPKKISKIMTKIYSYGVEPIGTFQEKEGITIIIKEEDIVKLSTINGFEFSDSKFSRITCCVHSSLDSIGLTAFISNAFTEQEISCNVVAGYYHDHFFVPYDRAEDAMNVLKQITGSYIWWG